MRNKVSSVILLILLTVLCYSCSSSKYYYNFKTGKVLDFSQGKWILNETQSNSSTKRDQILYDKAYTGFKKILGDSLLDLTSVRVNTPFPSSVSFNLSKSELKELHKYSNCDFLINVEGRIVANNAGLFSFNDPNSNEGTSNRSKVSIKIYDLKHGNLISESEVRAITWEKNDRNDKEGALKFTVPADIMMTKGLRKLINQYNKFRLDK